MSFSSCQHQNEGFHHLKGYHEHFMWIWNCFLTHVWGRGWGGAMMFKIEEKVQNHSACMCLSICVINVWPCKLLLEETAQKGRLLLPGPVRMSERLWAVFLASYCGHCIGASVSWDASHIMYFFFWGGWRAAVTGASKQLCGTAKKGPRQIR